MLSTPSQPEDEMNALFQQLPEGVIDIILHIVDPNTFASLAVLNHKWRTAADSVALYKHHLAQCPVVSEDDPADTTLDEDLPQLRRAFAQQVRRNLFSAYLTPRKRLLKLTAPSTSSSLAFPYGEVFKISFSPKGRWMLATSSSRIFIIHLPGPAPALWRELEVSRRPVAVDLAESGNFLAVLSPNQRVTTYRLDNHGVRCVQSIMLESASAAIALSSDCSVLAAAHDQYIEIISLSHGAEQLPITKRTVACNQVDSLAFHLDDAFLCGTSTKRRKPTTIVIPKPRPPVNDDGTVVEGDPGRLWTTEVLFPNTFQTCSHAIGLPSKRRLSPRVFAFDVPADVFGVLDLEEMAYGPITFALPQERASSLHLSTVMPSVTNDGIQVAFSSTKTGVWLYGDPNSLNMTITKTIQDHGTVPGCKISTGHKFSGLQWVPPNSTNSLRQQLVGVLPGGSLEHDAEVDQIKEPSDTAQILLLDFDYYVSDGSGTVEEITLQLNTGEIEKLEDDHIQLDTLLPSPRQELSASVSRQMRRQSVPLGRSITSATRNNSLRRRDQPSIGAPGARNTIAHGFSSNPSLASIPSIPRSATTASSGSRGRGEDADAMDDPYSHQQPRSRTTLQRAATASAGVRRQHLASLPSTPLQFRRADGRGELPHESDADNWVPPPPPYAAKSDTPLPHFMRQISLPLALAPQPQQYLYQSPSQRRWSTSSGPGQPLLVRARSYDDDLAAGALQRTQGTLMRSGTTVVVERPPLISAASFANQEPATPTPSSPPIPQSPQSPQSPQLPQDSPLPSPSPPLPPTIPFSNEEDARPMSANLADGFYSEPFTVWAADDANADADADADGADNEPHAAPQARQGHASLAATLARAASSARPEVVPTPPPPPPPLSSSAAAAAAAGPGAALEPDHYYRNTVIAPRPLDGVRDYYGPESGPQTPQGPPGLPGPPGGLYGPGFHPHGQPYGQAYGQPYGPGGFQQQGYGQQQYEQQLHGQTAAYGQRSQQAYPYPFQNRAVVVQRQVGGFGKERMGMGGGSGGRVGREKEREKGWRRMFKCVVM